LEEKTPTGNASDLKQLILEQDRIFRALGKKKLSAFSSYIDDGIDNQWFHNKIYGYLDKWIKKEIKKIAIFMPPQHGKSTMSSVMTPCKILGDHPSAKITVASYSDTVGSKFNREAQDLIMSPAYKAMYPDTRIPEKGVDKGNELKNNTYVETLKHKGYYRAVSIQGSLTSFTVEYGIIDDPIKSRKEANSATYRDALWEWYTDTWQKRLNNESCELLLFTRWHEDDLAGRLFDPNNEHYDKIRADKWTVIVLPALKENVPSSIEQAIEFNDPRNEGDALWDSFHSVESHLEDKRSNPYSFASLKQQRPSPLEGGMFKRAWFNRIKRNELPFNPDDDVNPVPMKFMIDGAFTDKVKNDPSASMSYRVYKGNIYIFNCMGVRKQLNEYLKFIHPWIQAQEWGIGSSLKVEYKASGPGLVSMLREDLYGSYPVSRINDKHVSWGKYTRGEYATPVVAGGKVYLVEGAWVEPFLHEVTTFPNNPHDDMFDLLCYACLEEMPNGKGKRYKSSVNLNSNKVI
tara:strand:+ start:1129 stop:2679 length:1551 start_codon:yes stop_codon:yes gene_type:complete